MILEIFLFIQIETEIAISDGNRVKGRVNTSRLNFLEKSSMKTVGLRDCQ